jgi:hypothetical protein
MTRISVIREARTLLILTFVGNNVRFSACRIVGYDVVRLRSSFRKNETY